MKQGKRLGLHQGWFGVALLKAAVTIARRLTMCLIGELPCFVPIAGLEQVNYPITLAIGCFFKRSAGIGEVAIRIDTWRKCGEAIVWLESCQSVQIRVTALDW